MPKFFLLFAFFLILYDESYGQESFHKRYRLEEYFIMKGQEKTSVHADSTFTKRDLYTSIESLNSGDKIFITGNRRIRIISGGFTKYPTHIVLQKGSIIELEHAIVARTETIVPYTSLELTDREKAEIDNRFKLDSVVNITSEEILPTGKATVTREVRVDQAFRNSLKVKKVVFNDSLGKAMANKKGYVKFEKEKLWVNPNLDGDFTSQGVYYYSLSNRQTVKLPFKEVSISAMTLPLKYRPSNDSKGIPHELTSSVNLNVFFGRTFSGLTKFHHREQVENIVNTRRWTYGAVLGASALTLDKNNTSATDKKITDDVTVTKGMATVGLGLVYSFNKFNIGGFTGIDYTIGNAIAKWNYNGRPWLGIAFGYSLFSFKEI